MIICICCKRRFKTLKLLRKHLRKIYKDSEKMKEAYEKSLPQRLLRYGFNWMNYLARRDGKKL